MPYTVETNRAQPEPRKRLPYSRFRVFLGLSGLAARSRIRPLDQKGASREVYQYTRRFLVFPRVITTVYRFTFPVALRATTR